MKPYIAALEHCLLLLRQCKEGEVSLLISNEQMAQIKPRSIKNRVRHNLTHQLANLIANDAGIHQGVVEGHHPIDVEIDPTTMCVKGDTQFTLRTVVMKASTYVDLLQGLNVLLAAALEHAYNEEPTPELEPVDDRQFDMFLEMCDA